MIGDEVRTMIYDVDTQRIEAQLKVLQTCSEVMEITTPRLQEEDRVAFFAASRALHLAVECVIDVGSVMIDGFIMRDPGGYLDIVDILEDEKVVPASGAVRLKELVRVRDRLVRHYAEVNREEVTRELENVEVFRDYVAWVRDYLDRELGSNEVRQGGGHL
ncbi:DUF86 domain-containing protein [Salinithrix halophila]|uniref:DUF86 domain-containing protein n=1 Tax=Salinithrix halophila TaxID=1485204 RepID=A0ABV8JC96_9BACL